jgi:hypothetical protein
LAANVTRGNRTGPGKRLTPMAASRAGSTDLLSVLNEEYATMFARDWNVAASGVGFVTRFDVEKSYLDQFEVHQVGGRTILEYWIPTDRLEEFNDHTVGKIEEVCRVELVDGDVVEFRYGSASSEPSN